MRGVFYYECLEKRTRIDILTVPKLYIHPPKYMATMAGPLYSYINKYM